jgi:DNA-binding transcriptional ArsR family regulator
MVDDEMPDGDAAPDAASDAASDAGGDAGGVRSSEAQVIGAEALHALAHPLRVRMYDELSSRGPATASELARRFGESTGATSYHLRQLARHGFIEEDPTRGTLRERYWRVKPGAQRFASPATLRDAPPATREAARLVLGEWGRGRAERVEYWRGTMHTWPLAWAEAGLELTGHIRLTVEELAELNADLRALVDRWASRVRDLEGDDRYDVEVQVNAFPLDPPRAYEGGLSSSPADFPLGPPPPPATPPAPLPPAPSPFPPPPPRPF